MRILFVSSSSGSRGGGEFYIVYLAEALKALGHEVGLWLSTDPQMDGIAELFSKTGPVIRHPYVNTYLRRSRSLSHLKGPGKRFDLILDQWKSFRPDFLHLNKQCLEDGLDLLELGNRWNIPQGCTIHITQTAKELKAFMGGFRDWIARRSLRKYKGALWAIAANREFELKRFIGHDKKIGYIPNGVRIPELMEIERERARMQDRYVGLIGKDGPVAISVGRLEEQKDPMRFLDIVGTWKEKEPALSAIWVGDGRLRTSFENRIRKMEAGDWIHCVGWQEDALPFLCLADVYVHPARFEGLPFALLEAMAHGLPCLISPELAKDLTDIPIDNWILATEDARTWLDQLMQPELLNGLGRSSRDLASESFSLEVMARKYVELYERSIRGEGPDR